MAQRKRGRRQGTPWQRPSTREVLSKWRLTSGTSPPADSKGACYNGGRSFGVEALLAPSKLQEQVVRLRCGVEKL